MWDAIGSIVGKAQSELFLFLILLIILVIIAMKPLLAYFRSKKEQEAKREQNILTVITGNSTVMSELKTLLKETNDNCKDCKAEQLEAFQRVEDKNDANAIVLNDINHNLQELVHTRIVTQ